MLTGDNFAKASDTQLGLPYPIALGAAAKKHKFEIEELIPLFLQSNISNLLAAAQRLLPLGHKRSTGILKNLFETVCSNTFPLFRKITSVASRLA